MIKILIQDTQRAKEFQVQGTHGHITNLKKINLFIGENNSGKSRLLRSLFIQFHTSTSKLNIIPQDANQARFISEYTSRLEPVIKTIVGRLRKHYDPEVITAFTIILEKMYNNAPPYNINIHAYIELASMFDNLHNIGFIGVDIANIHNLLDEVHKVANNMLHHLSFLVPTKKPSYEILYIPTLRGLRPIHFDKDLAAFSSVDAYAMRTSSDYFDIELKNTKIFEHKIFTGLTLYEDIKKHLLGTVKEREMISSFESYLERNIFHCPVTLIPKYDDDVLHIKVGDEEQYPIYNLGDGMQTLITILFPIFIRRGKKTVIFLEEPEHHLHPSLQRILIEALGDMDDNHQIFVSTHSSVFMNRPDTCVYHINRGHKISILNRISLSNEARTLLNNMGYTASDIYLSNFILWVEGASDKIYFEYWIGKLSDGQLVVGKHYEIMMYHGSFQRHVDIDTFSNISSHYGVYIDSDRESKTVPRSTDKLAIMKRIENAGQYCWISRKRSIENYIPHDVYIDAVSSVHFKNDIDSMIVVEGDYINRGYVQDLSKRLEFKQRIKIGNDLWSIIQRNGNASTSGIRAQELRVGIEESIRSTGNQRIAVDKVKVAMKVTTLRPKIVDKELSVELRKIVKLIYKANGVLPKDQVLSV